MNAEWTLLYYKDLTALQGTQLQDTEYEGQIDMPTTDTDNRHGIPYSESPAFSVSQVIREHGYILANKDGQLYTSVHHDRCHWGLLKPRKKDRNWFHKMFGMRGTPLWVGYLKSTDSNDRCDREEPRTWTLYIYGKCHVDELLPFAKTLGDKLDVKIVAELSTEHKLYRQSK